MFRQFTRLIARDNGTARVVLTPATRFRVDVRTRITRAHDDGRVVMHLDAGRVWAINGIGSQIWQLLADGQSLQAIVDTLAFRYPERLTQIESDVAAFINRLVALRLICPVADGAAPATLQER